MTGRLLALGRSHHLKKVAAEIASLPLDVDMDMKTVQAIADEERYRRRERQ